MRLFMALQIPREERRKIGGLQSGLAFGRPVHTEDLHVTMAFLGNGTAAQVDELAGAIAGLQLVLPEVRLSEPGVFGRVQPKAVWLGVTPGGPLGRLHRKLVRLATDHGFEVPNRKYIPHVTLARFSPGAATGRSLADFLESCAATKCEPFQPRSLTICQSLIGREAPIYEELFGFPIVPA